jgi:hypothetical protein
MRWAGQLALAALISALAFLPGGKASADELAMPKTVERDTQVTAAYRFDEPATGHGFLDVEWTDAVGREVERRHIPLDLVDASQVTFRLDMRRAVTVKNRLAAHLSLDGTDRGGAPFHRRDDRVTSFIASPPAQGWRDYQIIMWQQQTPAAYDALKRLGITAGVVGANRSEGGTYVSAQLSALLDQDLGFYLENIATDFYSPYHRWSGNRPVDWRFLEVEALHRQKPDDIAAFIRDPSLSDPDWLEQIDVRLTRDVTALRGYRPLYYNLGDETGIAELTRFWDFDFSAASLAAMRDWLNQRYGSLTALNRQWGSHFDSWNQVMPMTTRQAIEKSDENFSAWADFKEWMDIAFASALASGSAAVHAADPNALSAIEGVQIPGWGGYDYSRLARSVDVMEPYDFDDDIEIWRSLNPKLVLLTTSFSSGAEAAYRTWRELLRGTRGLILWDENNGFAAADGGSLGERGRQAASYFSEIRGGLGALLINSRRHTDPVAVLYSQASMRVDWLLDRRARGEPASASASEALGDPWRTSSRNFVQLLEHMGLEPRFVSAEQVEGGGLRTAGYRILMLPHAVALAPAEATEIRGFVAKGGVAIADGEPGLFDEHGRRVGKPLLSDVFAGPANGATTRFAFGKGAAIYLAFPGTDDTSLVQRLRGLLLAAGIETAVREAGDDAPVRGVLAATGIEPAFSVLGAHGKSAADIETHIFENGPATILALQRDLPTADPAGREAITVALPRRLDVYDLRARRARGETDRVALDLGPGEPAILALSPTPLAAPSITGPAAAHLGENAEFQIRTGPPEAPAVIHIEAVDPDGRVVLPYSGNILAPHGEAAKLLPLAFNDKSGIWQIRATDVLSGQTATADLLVER